MEEEFQMMYLTSEIVEGTFNFFEIGRKTSIFMVEELDKDEIKELKRTAKKFLEEVSFVANLIFFTFEISHR